MSSIDSELVARDISLVNQSCIKHQYVKYSKVVGRGGFGTVYLGNCSTSAEGNKALQTYFQQNGQNTPVAIKILDKYFAIDHTSAEKMFYQEAMALMTATYPNVVTYLGMCKIPLEKLPASSRQVVAQLAGEVNSPVIYGQIQEYMGGKTIAHKIFEQMQYPWKKVYDDRTALLWILDVAKGLRDLHDDSDIKIIHRDIKKENILLSAQHKFYRQTAKICDLGLAVFVSKQGVDSGVTSAILDTNDAGSSQQASSRPGAETLGGSTKDSGSKGDLYTGAHAAKRDGEGLRSSRGVRTSRGVSDSVASESYKDYRAHGRRSMVRNAQDLADDFNYINREDYVAPTPKLRLPRHKHRSSAREDPQNRHVRTDSDDFYSVDDDSEEEDVDMHERQYNMQTPGLPGGTRGHDSPMGYGPHVVRGGAVASPGYRPKYQPRTSRGRYEGGADELEGDVIGEGGIGFGVHQQYQQSAQQGGGEQQYYFPKIQDKLPWDELTPQVDVAAYTNNAAGKKYAEPAGDHAKAPVGFDRAHDVYPPSLSPSNHYKSRPTTRPTSTNPDSNPTFSHYDPTHDPSSSPYPIPSSSNPYNHTSARDSLSGVNMDEQGALNGLPLTQQTGSFLYMAPEVFWGQPYDEKADVFSLAVLMYEVFHRSSIQYVRVGGVVADHSSLKLLAQAVATGSRPPVSDKVTRKLGALIKSCWAQKPEQRPACKEVVEVLEAVLVDMDKGRGGGLSGKSRALKSMFKGLTGGGEGKV